MTTPADELRTAAERLRTTANAVQSAPGIDNAWAADGTTVTQGVYPDTGEPIYPVADAASPQCAAHIALMDPALGLLVADWLEREAARRHALDVGQPIPDGEPALAVARQINGGTP